MRRILPVVVCFVFLTTLLGPDAFGAHEIPPKGNSNSHENIPTNKTVITDVKATCRFSGIITYTGGVSAQRSHDHYTLGSATAVCAAAPGSGLQGQNLAGTYTVTASGGTDGHDEAPKNAMQGPMHGEDCANGYSHSDGYGSDADHDIGAKPSGGKPAGASVSTPKTEAKNKGFIQLSNGAGKNGRGWVKFVRVGKIVEVWGWINWDVGSGKKSDKFQGSLTTTELTMDNGKFASAEEITAACSGLSGKKIKSASVTSDPGVIQLGDGVNAPQNNKP